VRLNVEKEGVSVSVIREIQSLLKLSHANIVGLLDVAVGRKVDKVFLVMEYCNEDLASLLDNMKSPFTESQVKCLMLQLFEGVKYLHANFVIHRDIKVSNLLLTGQGILKIADFGLARLYGEPPLQMTPRVVTLWYRSPELLFGSLYQSTAVDMWSCGCIFGELLLHKPLMPGKDELDQIRRIIHLLGTPTERIWPGMTSMAMTSKIQLFQQPYNNIKAVFSEATPECIDLLNSLFVYDPSRRASAEQCLASQYFSISPLPCDPTMMPSLKTLKKK
jgi:cyclin-dependent kinase 10